MIKKDLLGIIALESVPFFMGFGLGMTGRKTEEPMLPAIPLILDAMYNAEGYSTPKGAWGLLKYGLGVATAYSDKIIPIIDKYVF